MSGQWEVVGKKKDKGNPKVEKQISKKKTENFNVKVEEVLTSSQVKNLYNNGKNKENKPFEIKKVSEVGLKKNQKKPEKSQEPPPKAKTPKSIESALNQIDIEEFKNLFERSKSQFPDAPIIWLKELSHFLNQRINLDVQDPIFISKPPKFPLLIVPSGITSVIERAAQEANKSNVQLFYDIALTSMATDMSKNLPAIGHKLFLQYIALSEPSLVIINLTKHIVLRNSYQNRPNIGMSILWAVGQAGISDFQIGLKIFQELMLPLIELKHYSKYIVKYLIDLIKNADGGSLTREQYVMLLESIFSNKKNFPNDLKQELISISPNLKFFLFGSHKSETFHSSLEFYLKKITTNDSYLLQECLCDVIIQGLNRDQSSLDHWSKIYVKNIAPSAILLEYIDNNWQAVSNKLNRKALQQTVDQIITLNNELVSKKKKDQGSVKTAEILQRLLEKMASKKQTGLSFKFLFFMLCSILAAFVYFDIRREGSWQNSNINRILKNWGVCEYTHIILHRIKQGLLLINDQLEENFPVYYHIIANFLEPYIELLRNLGYILYNIFHDVQETVLEKYPVVLQSVELYTPGFVKQSQSAVNSVWSSSILYFNNSIVYLQKEVFVGQLSPENMQRVLCEAFNATQNKATEYYHWLYEKVQNTIK
ncbi:unnamed protein product [Tenebrio molitor]|jgi:hypothetical protein|nr:unnamed protein product [Tenebrio molitor]